MSRRILYLARHGEADALGALTDRGRRQSRLLGERLAERPIDVIWHSPLSRAANSAAELARSLPPVLVDEAEELIDHLPFVPDRTRLAPVWGAFFDGIGLEEVAAGERLAVRLTARFATPTPAEGRITHEVLVTHAYQVAWMVREALGAPPECWMSLAGMANTGLTAIEYDASGPPIVRCVNDRSHLVEPTDGAST